MPVLSTDAIEFYSVWISKKSFPLSFFIESLSADQQKNLLKKYVESLESDLPLSFFIGLGLLRGPGKRTGAALLLPVNFNSQTKEFSTAGLPVENPVLAEMEGFPEPEAAQVEKKFSLQEYFRRLKIFISTQEGWKFTEKGVSLSLLPSEKFISAVRIGRLYRNIESEKLGKIANEFLGEGLCAIDLAGDEKSMPNALFGNLFAEAKKLDYSYTIHAGECGSVQCIKDAVEMGAKRIGHGIAMMGNKEVQKLLASKRIGVEMCPISNYQTKALQPEQTYPLREFVKAGVLATINTDNRTVSNTSITKELEFLNQKCGISEEELYQCQMNAVDVAFCDDAMKHEIWKALK
jgi:hypothetical protein